MSRIYMSIISFELVITSRDESTFVQAMAWSGPILGLRPANERRRYFVTTSLVGWAQT